MSTVERDPRVLYLEAFLKQIAYSPKTAWEMYLGNPKYRTITKNFIAKVFEDAIQKDIDMNFWLPELFARHFPDVISGDSKQIYSLGCGTGAELFYLSGGSLKATITAYENAHDDSILASAVISSLVCDVRLNIEDLFHVKPEEDIADNPIVVARHPGPLTHDPRWLSCLSDWANATISKKGRMLVTTFLPEEISVISSKMREDNIPFRVDQFEGAPLLIDIPIQQNNKVAIFMRGILQNGEFPVQPRPDSHVMVIG